MVENLLTYNQPTKVAARREALAHAVQLVSSRRSDAALVPEDYVNRVRQRLLASDRSSDAYAHRACTQDSIASWREFRAQSIGTRNASELTVAYLAGPQPSNDLLTFVSLGLRPENIWAFETDADAITAGLSDLEKLGLREIKFIPLSISEYFVGTQRRFDIIYIDACAPLPSHTQHTTRLLVDVFKNSALNPLSVLITNFAKPDISKAEELERFAFLVAAYLYPKSFVESKGGGMREGPEVYSYFLQNPEEPDKCFVSEVKTTSNFITGHLSLDMSWTSPQSLPQRRG
jgi:hypothetical protein